MFELPACRENYACPSSHLLAVSVSIQQSSKITDNAVRFSNIFKLPGGTLGVYGGISIITVCQAIAFIFHALLDLCRINVID